MNLPSNPSCSSVPSRQRCKTFNAQNRALPRLSSSTQPSKPLTMMKSFDGTYFILDVYLKRDRWNRNVGGRNTWRFFSIGGSFPASLESCVTVVSVFEERFHTHTSYGRSLVSSTPSAASEKASLAPFVFGALLVFQSRRPSYFPCQSIHLSIYILNLVSLHQNIFTDAQNCASFSSTAIFGST